MPCNRKLRRHERLVQQYEYQEVIKKGTVFTGKRFKTYLLVNGAIERRAGFIAGRAVGGACERNRARRLLREAYRQLKRYTAPRGFRVVFVAGRGIADATEGDIQADMKTLFERRELLTGEWQGE